MKKQIPTHDPQTGELNPYYEELTGGKNPMWQEPHKEINYMPDQKWHRYVSFIKSGVRIIGYGIILIGIGYLYYYYCCWLHWDYYWFGYWYYYYY
jgi:hypothetical protein